ncbi:GNAT family N-acetyltransferase [Serratia fonticola]|uniref:GNAT family N-acetyltransferase n=1 Tax=Serratia fonticola TaxID=47917 RepID=UPI0021BDCA2C|nr:GNAT family N-acetyltransferase [Serratia fonticola]
MFKTFKYQQDPELAEAVCAMLRDDAKSPFDVFSEPLSNLLGRSSYPVEDLEIGILLNDDGLPCGYAVFSSTEIKQFYISKSFRRRGLGKYMLEFLKQIYKEKGAAIIELHAWGSEQAREFWASCGAYCEDSKSQLWCIEL